MFAAQIVDPQMLRTVQEVGPPIYLMVVSTVIAGLYILYRIEKSKAGMLEDIEDRRTLRQKAEIVEEAKKEAEITVRGLYQQMIEGYVQREREYKEEIQELEERNVQCMEQTLALTKQVEINKKQASENKEKIQGLEDRLTDE